MHTPRLQRYNSLRSYKPPLSAVSSPLNPLKVKQLHSSPKIYTQRPKERLLSPVAFGYFRDRNFIRSQRTSFSKSIVKNFGPNSENRFDIDRILIRGKRKNISSTSRLTK